MSTAVLPREHALALCVAEEEISLVSKELDGLNDEVGEILWSLPVVDKPHYDSEADNGRECDAFLNALVEETEAALAAGYAPDLTEAAGVVDDARVLEIVLKARTTLLLAQRLVRASDTMKALAYALQPELKMLKEPLDA